MSHEISINVRLLKAVACATGKEETRYYLKGVHVEFFNDHISLCATDGHKLIAARQLLAADNVPATGQRGIIIPLELIDRLKVGRKAPDYVTLAFESTESDYQWRALRMTYDGATFVQGEIEGSFPAARRVCPTEISGKAASFDPLVLSTFSRAAKTAGVESAIPTTHCNGGDPALVDWLPGDALPGCLGFGVAMPCRVRNQDLPATGWFTGSNAYRTTPEDKFKAETERLKAKA